MDTIDEIRKKIEAHHEEAMKALEVLKGYLSGSHHSTNGTGGTKGGTEPPRTGASSKRPSLGKREGSMRAKVLAVLKASWSTIDEIAAKTELEKKNVRGVVNAPTLKSLLEFKDEDGKRQYRLKPTEPVKFE